MTHEAFLLELARMLDVPEGSIRGNEPLSEFRLWDSLASVSFIALADEAFGRSVAVDELVMCSTVDDLARLVGVAK